MKRLFVLIITAVFLLSACGTAPKAKSDNQQHAVKDKSPSVTKSDKKKSSDTSAEGQTSDKSSEKTDKTQTKTSMNQTTKPSYKIDPKSWSVVPLDPSNKKKVVLITIDDAPDQHALEMAKTMKSLNVTGIFFVNGMFLKGDQKAKELKQIYNMGFMIGNHTDTHPNLSKLPASKQIEQIQAVTKRVKDITGTAPAFFRAPFGVNTDVSRNEVKKEGMVLMNWSFGYDWHKQYENKKALTKIMLNTPYLHNGAILLMHDRPWTAAALKDIITGLRKKGYVMVNPHDIETYKNQR